MIFGCEEARRYADAWVDGELDPAASLHVETHVARCENCRLEAEGIRRLKRMLGALREQDAAPTALRNRLSAILDAEDTGQKTLQADAEAQARKHKNARNFTMVGAALAAVVFGLGKQNAQSSLNEQQAGLLPAVFDDIASRHARNLPVEVSAPQPEQLAGFFAGRVDIPVRPMSFRGMPTQLVGARISNVRDRMAAALFYNVDGRRVTVFMFDGSLVPRYPDGSVHPNNMLRRTLHNNDQVYIGNAHGYTIAVSEHGGVGYAVASDLPPQDALRIVEHAEIQ